MWSEQPGTKPRLPYLPDSGEITVYADVVWDYKGTTHLDYCPNIW